VKNVAAVDGATRDALNGVCVGVGAGAEGVNAEVVIVEVDVVCTVYITVLINGGFAGEDVGAAGVCEARGVGEGDAGLRRLRSAMILR
jgi:hypothetical protein